MNEEESECKEPPQKVPKLEDCGISAEFKESSCGSGNCEIRDSEKGLSKRQLKKLKKKEQWLQNRSIKRAKEKDKLKAKKLEARLNNIKLGPSRKELKNSRMSTSKCKVTVVIDMSFDDLMNDRDIGKCVKQIHRCYSLNRRAKDPLQFYVSSFGGKTKSEMNKHEGYQNWDVYIRDESYMDIFDKTSIVYLTSESENVISKLEDDKVYIIGGLVDHNAHKGLCYQLAKDKDIAHGRLPLDEFIEMKARRVLTIDHVFEIMMYVCQGNSWDEAFLHVLPLRKGAVKKNTNP